VERLAAERGGHGLNDVHGRRPFFSCSERKSRQAWSASPCGTLRFCFAALSVTLSKLGVLLQPLRELAEVSIKIGPQGADVQADPTS
jgi:hypothetical protein